MLIEHGCMHASKQQGTWMKPTVSVSSTSLPDGRVSRRVVGSSVANSLSSASTPAAVRRLSSVLLPGRPHARLRTVGPPVFLLYGHPPVAHCMHRRACVGVAHERDDRQQHISPAVAVLLPVPPHLAHTRAEMQRTDPRPVVTWPAGACGRRPHTSSTCRRSCAMRRRSRRLSISICFSPMPRVRPPACRSTGPTRKAVMRCLHLRCVRSKGDPGGRTVRPHACQPRQLIVQLRQRDLSRRQRQSHAPRSWNA